MALHGNPGDVIAFAYTGSMQSVTIPADGIYKLECWGPGGGTNGGPGGASTGYKIFRRGQIVYVGVGQTGGSPNVGGNRFNGGRDGTTPSNPAHWYGKYAGSGCTHMATANGELATLSNNRGSVLLVAGGGGTGTSGGGVGGPGGGSSGLAGSSGANGGTQTSGAGFGVGGACTSGVSGGGAGWYGGDAGNGGGGGSGYVGGVPSFEYQGQTYAPATVAAAGRQPNVDGGARITMVRTLMLPVVFDGTQLSKVVANGVEITSLVFNGAKIF